MKTALLSVLTATVLGFVSRFGGRAFDAVDFTAILFVTGLVAWTVDQYSRPSFQPLAISRPLRLPVRLTGERAPKENFRLAA
jgi:hypothetical protein